MDERRVVTRRQITRRRADRSSGRRQEDTVLDTLHTRLDELEQQMIREGEKLAACQRACSGIGKQLDAIAVELANARGGAACDGGP